MELVFFYANQSASNFINRTGFNFSSRYNFYLRDDKILGVNAVEKEIPKDFFDASGCITNITGIVGENGSGKTTLLNILADYSGRIKKKPRSEEYTEYVEEEYKKIKSLTIYEEDSKLLCFHNFDSLLYEGQLELTIIDIDNQDFQKEVILENKYYRNISTISLSNCYYAKQGAISSYQSIDKVSFNVNSMNIIKKLFYKSKSYFHNNVINLYSEMQRIIREQKSMDDFQNIIDLLYIYHLEEQNIKSIFEIKRTIEIDFECINTILKRENISEYEYDEFIEKIIIKSNDFKTNVFFKLYYNLLFEMNVYYSKKKEDSICDQEITINQMEDLIEKIVELLNYYKSINDKYSLYFEEAFQEIKIFENELAIYPRTNTHLPVSDGAYRKYIKIDYNKDEYKKFLCLLKDYAYNKKSFVLKYIRFHNLQFASGERSLLNFFSWLHIAPRLNELGVEGIESQPLKRNILLLIDEIDLYFHPLWQQKIIAYLINQIKMEYSGKKVQIIFTTHSPIILSDMPKSNIIFLKKQSNKCVIDDNLNHAETFGGNIYQLYNDAFFLGEKSQIGEFAKEKIRHMICEIQSVEQYKDYDSLEREISIIGEKILRLKMLERLKYKTEAGISFRNRQIQKYQEKIERLMELKNDTD